MLFCFSATGNSLFLAQKMSEAGGGHVLRMDGCLREGETRFEAPAGEPLGFVFPVYFSGLPTIVADFLEKADIRVGPGTYVFVAVTCGLSPGNAGGMAEKILSKKGVHVDGMFRVVMPHTWTPIQDLSDRRKVDKVLEDAVPMTEDAVEGMKARRRCRMPDATSALMAKPLYSVYSLQKTKIFWVTDMCDGCGECRAICPSRIIKMENRRPVIVESRCAMCLACLHRCPMFAIQYGRATIGHGRYVNPSVSLRSRPVHVSHEGRVDGVLGLQHLYRVGTVLGLLPQALDHDVREQALDVLPSPVPLELLHRRRPGIAYPGGYPLEHVPHEVDVLLDVLRFLDGFRVVGKGAQVRDRLLHERHALLAQGLPGFQRGVPLHVHDHQLDHRGRHDRGAGERPHPVQLEDPVHEVAQEPSVLHAPEVADQRRERKDGQHVLFAGRSRHPLAHDVQDAVVEHPPLLSGEGLRPGGKDVDAFGEPAVEDEGARDGQIAHGFLAVGQDASAQVVE
ncbi:MAG: EFR1 family ferrodoxin [Candidatus Methanomethylophilaceae archaeon]|nr:EFR1 family ferrodoxin [Candidatus Methanomethylophilaceae archaeon]